MIFREEQTLLPRPIKILVVIIGVFLFLYILIASPAPYFLVMPTLEEWTIALVVPLAVILLLKMNLKTTIDKEKIHVRYIPFINKTFDWKEIQQKEVIDYGFVGGWGIRIWTKYGTVYNTSGSKGLFIRLKNGKKYVIGTQREKELATFIAQMI